ncbi:MAG: DUF6046 domain-containing protein [Bacteroidetes bacterium]|nr:DUF6046 domain-containing protein [Bacteroidota bacterium]
MAQTDFSINALLERAFGIGRGLPFDSSKAETPQIRTEQPFEDVPASNDQEGAEFMQMRLSVNSSLPTGQSVFMPMRLGGLVLPNEPSIIVSSRKNIVETALAGSSRRGTVKELISVEDWSVTIRGVVINYDSVLVYPEDEVKALRDLYNLNEALDVESALTNLLGIYRLVIKEFLLPEMIGIQHAQAYQFICTSDEDFILEL